MNTMFACLPCYNEEENIVPLVEGWLAQEDQLQHRGYRLEVVAIDDTSTAATLEKMQALAAEHPQVTVVSHPETRKLGGALDTAVA